MFYFGGSGVFFFVCLPQQASRRFNIIIQLQTGAAVDGHTVVIFNLHRVLHIVRLGHRAAIFDLQQQEAQQQVKFFPSISLFLSWFQEVSQMIGFRSTGLFRSLTMVLQRGSPSGSVRVPPYTTGSCSGSICSRNTSCQLPAIIGMSSFTKALQNKVIKQHYVFTHSYFSIQFQDPFYLLISIALTVSFVLICYYY